MHLYDLLRMLEPSFDHRQAKVHLAKWNGQHHPMDVFLAGEFDDWQAWQEQRNFERPLVVSLVHDLPNQKWMFAGLFKSHGCTPDLTAKKPHYDYLLERIPSTAELEGRLILGTSYKKRNCYLRGETLADDLTVLEYLPERRTIGQFPGYKQVNITKAELDRLVAQRVEGWRTALSSVKGIYLITDTKTHKLYVGKADGEDGIWGRWCQYAATGHGFNKALVQELGIKASDRQRDLRFSLLEIADLQSGPGEIERRETHWKEILQSRLSGYNRN